MKKIKGLFNFKHSLKFKISSLWKKDMKHLKKLTKTVKLVKEQSLYLINKKIN